MRARASAVHPYPLISSAPRVARFTTSRPLRCRTRLSCSATMPPDGDRPKSPSPSQSMKSAASRTPARASRRSPSSQAPAPQRGGHVDHRVGARDHGPPPDVVGTACMGQMACSARRAPALLRCAHRTQGRTGQPEVLQHTDIYEALLARLGCPQGVLGQIRVGG